MSDKKTAAQILLENLKLNIADIHEAIHPLIISAMTEYAEQERVNTFNECRKQVDIGHCPEFVYDNWQDYSNKNPLV